MTTMPECVHHIPYDTECLECQRLKDPDSGLVIEIRIKPVGPSSTAGLEAGLQRAPQNRPRVAVRALSPITPGPAAIRSAMLEMCLAIAAGLGTEWSQEKCRAQVAAGPLGLIRAHDMQVGRK